MMTAEKPMNFTAVWEDLITLTWDANGGAFSDTASQHTSLVAKNNPLAFYPEIPERPGYRFDTWVIASGANAGTIYRYTALPEDTVLEATWIQQVVVSFDMGPGFTRDSEEFDINKRWVDSLALNTTIYKDGNKVVVGYLTPDGTVYNGEALTQDLHLTAIWEDGLTVTLDANGGTINDATLPTTVLVKPNMPAALPSIDSLFTKDGYVGMDWTFADGTPYNYELITADTTLYAQYAVPVTVIIDGNGGKVLDPKDWTYKDQIIDKIKPNTTIRSLAGERQGYIFGGLLAPDGRIYSYQNIGSDITFKAIWGKAITVSFDMGPDVTRTSEIIAEGSKWVETKYTPGMNGLVVSYYTLPDGTRYTDQILKEDTKLTAVWEKMITVHFSAGDGRWVTTEFMDNLITVPAGTMPYDISGTDFTMFMQKDGMLWAGWNFADGTPADRVPLTEDTTLYARYGEAVEITFIYGGGTALQSSTMRFGKGYIGEISAPLRATDRFMGYRRPDGRYYPASHRFIVFDESMTLTAMWNEITATTEGDVALKFLPYSDGTQAEQIRANLKDSNFAIPLDQVFLYTEHVPGYTPSSDYGTQLPPPPPNTTRDIDSETYDVGFENLDGQRIQPAAGELVEFYVPLGDFDPNSIEVVHVGADGEEVVDSQVIGSSVYIKGPGFSYYVIRGAVLTPITPEETTSSTSASETTTTTAAGSSETTTTTTVAAGEASSTTTKAAESSSTAATTKSVPRTGERQAWPYALGGLLLVLAGFATILLRKNQRDETKLD